MAHIASLPCLRVASAAAPLLALPLSPVTSPSIPRSIIANNIAWTALLSLWFLVFRLAVLMSVRIVVRIKLLRELDVDWGSKGNSVCNSLHIKELVLSSRRQMRRLAWLRISHPCSSEWRGPVWDFFSDPAVMSSSSQTVMQIYAMESRQFL